MKLKNNSNRNINEISELLGSFYPFAKERMGFDKDPEVCFESDPENAQYALGKTAYYNPEDMTITIYVDGRHPKDIMRSLSHELVHHNKIAMDSSIRDTRQKKATPKMTITFVKWKRKLILRAICVFVIGKMDIKNQTHFKKEKKDCFINC